MIAWESWALQRVFHIASDIPDGPPDCAETVASNGYCPFKKDRTSPMMCWASDSLICANEFESGLDTNILKEGACSRWASYCSARSAFRIEEVERLMSI
jgi:hypothetical protein